MDSLYQLRVAIEFMNNHQSCACSQILPEEEYFTAVIHLLSVIEPETLSCDDVLDIASYHRMAHRYPTKDSAPVERGGLPVSASNFQIHSRVFTLMGTVPERSKRSSILGFYSKFAQERKWKRY